MQIWWRGITKFTSQAIFIVYGLHLRAHIIVSLATAKTPRALEGSDKLVQRLLEIIAYHNPSSYFLENPQSGLMKTRAVVQGLEFVDTSYCKYSFTYRKNTRFWTNCKHFKPQPMCCRLAPCETKAELDHHETTAQRGPGKLQRKLKTNDRQSLNQLYSMPETLCDEIAFAANLSQVVALITTTWSIIRSVDFTFTLLSLYFHFG